MQIFKTDPKLSPFKKAHKTQVFRIWLRRSDPEIHTFAWAETNNSSSWIQSSHFTLSLSLSQRCGPARKEGHRRWHWKTPWVLSPLRYFPLLFNYRLFGCSESHKKSKKVIKWVSFLSFFSLYIYIYIYINATLFWLLKFECEIK